MRMPARDLLRPVLLLAVAAALLWPGTANAGQRHPSWPTLEKQLAHDKVVPGSALEKLIRENQDVKLLGPGEAPDDGLGYPLWLRVYWRRLHPESVSGAGDATGGYPLILSEIGEWLIHHQDLRPGPRDPDVPPPTNKLAVGTNQRISGSTTLHRSESNIRVNPGNPSYIIAACNNNITSGQQTQMYSSNGGSSWGQTSLPLTGSDSFHSDPAVDWTSDGKAWATTIGVQLDGSGHLVQLQVRAYRSSDSGATWTYDAGPSGTQTSTDKEMLWVDHSASSSYKDYIYSIWDLSGSTPAHVFVSRKNTPSGSWSTPLQVSGAETTGTGVGTDIKTNASGNVFAFWPDTGSRHLYVAKSTNGAGSFGSPATITTTTGSYQIAIPADNARKPVIYITGGAFSNASKDLVYAAWMDLDRTGCTAPGSTVSSTCKTRIWFSRSTNGGTSWSTPVKINDPSSLNDQFSPWLNVDEVTGGLTVAYYDTVNDAGRLKADVWAQYSADDGVTWGSAVKVTTAQSDETVAGADASQYGDYNGLSGISGILFPSWTDRRNGNEEIWSAKLTNPLYQGYHDGANCMTANGWAWDLNSQSDRISVDVYDGSTKLGTATANLYRSDLLAAGIGDGYHAWNYTLPSSVRDGASHTIRVKYANTNTDLSTTPKTVTCTSIFTTQTPATFLAGSNYENSTIFTSSVSGTISALRFYKAPGETGTHVGNLWTDTGTLLASVTFTGETSSGWQIQTLSAPVAIAANTNYRVSYGFNAYLSKTNCGLSPAISNGSLTTAGSSYATPNGSFPNTGSCSNYFADVVFNP